MNTAERARRDRYCGAGAAFVVPIWALTTMKLLRFLQKRTFERVGGNGSLKVDVRVIAATHQDLVAEVNAGRFREDLDYRLNVVKVDLSPLRARPNDILPLAMHFLVRFANEHKKALLAVSARIQYNLNEYGIASQRSLAKRRRSRQPGTASR